ncbi:uncharacterized protein K452DRAFT_295394 [Aplosporella prunicola CBS 121167]|uniref:FAM50A/XAP5 C-terminal domain-containing protein n=1 Tax=Aplosporella prunicola CBS 121167 TaxID=1176127 RepID=A0A6A6BQX6_9PEZI|nr:uncharacterized protein K452DRAFT_295394 [Aplosporella prunicola CBS 121167]KAF2145833.1 hypothetical protein K452DRAFT_295394 [Aplosporella prunicola CBS 121167]
MDRSNPSSADPSRSGTPNTFVNPRFTSQASTAEDLLKSQTVGLVQLSDFRKRRAEALELKDRERQDQLRGKEGTPGTSGAATPSEESTPRPPKKKKKKTVAKGKLSFGLDDEEEGGESGTGTSAAVTPRSMSNMPADERAPTATEEEKGPAVPKRRLGPNTNVAVQPKVMTKSAMVLEDQRREQARKEFLEKQELAKATEFALPFVFYDGTNIPGGKCRVKKGDYVWLFLDKARKVGAELGVGGDKSRREWARVSVDDLMLVRGEIIIPHHYEFYYFMMNKTVGFGGRIFEHSDQPTKATPLPQSEEDVDLATYDPLARPDPKKEKSAAVDESLLEGLDEDATMTKVVDRRWYERNKHIFPASVWEEFDPKKDYTKGNRKDTEGNSFFFS